MCLERSERNEYNDDKKIYEFTQIQRLAKLNQTKTLDIFQQAQAFLGRIGLPVSINFMDDYVVERWKLQINNRIIEEGIDFYIKYVTNNINDALISIADLEKLLCRFYIENTEICNEFSEICNFNQIATYNYASGLRQISQKKNKKCLNALCQKGILLTYTDKEHTVNVKVSKFVTCYLNGNDITENINSFGFDNDGE